MTVENHKVVAEISIIPLGKRYLNDELPTSIRNELAIAIDAIKKVKGIKIMVTGMGTSIIQSPGYYNEFESQNSSSFLLFNLQSSCSF
jgi:hypothetical protein